MIVVTLDRVLLLGDVIFLFCNTKPWFGDVFSLTLGSFSKHNGNVLRNKRIVHTKQRERIISSPNGLINNVLVL